MSKLGLILFGSPLADIQTRTARRITIGALGAVLAVLALIAVAQFVPVLKEWWWAPAGLILLFALWSIWQLLVGMHLAAQWLGIIAERQVRFGGVAREGDEASEQNAADAIALTSDEDEDARPAISATEGPTRAGREKWQQREDAAQASRAGQRTRAPDPGDTRAMSDDEHSQVQPSPPGPARPRAPKPPPPDEDPAPLNRRIVKNLDQKSDDDTVDEDAD
ncbi:MAG: hypothetical protein ACKVS8_12495 [Phycisphaerales bacterium]